MKYTTTIQRASSISTNEVSDWLKLLSAKIQPSVFNKTMETI